jgi:glycosyltransferase involved in cell wall biosynthesis
MVDLNAGAPSVTSHLRHQFQAAGHPAEVYSFDNIHRVVPPRLEQVIFPLAVAKALWNRADAYDVIDASSGDTWIFGLLPVKRPLLVVRSHGLEHVANEELLMEEQLGLIDLSWKFPIYHGGWRLKEVALSFRSADVAIFLNSYDRDYAVDNFGVERKRAFVLPNGLPDQFLGLPFEPTPAAGEPIKIAQIGAYIHRKGVRYSADALRSVLARHREVTVSFLGTCVSPNVVLRDFDPALHSQIRVVPRYEQGSLPNLLRGHQIKLFPTLSEGFSLALAEAMACGLAPAATSIPGCLEIIEEDRNGLTLPPRNSAAVCSALERLLEDRGTLDRLRRTAYKDAQQYSWRAVAAKTLDLYEEAAFRKAL